VLVTPPAPPAGFEATLAAALAAGDVASVIVRLDPADPKTALALAKRLVPVAQEAGAAALLTGDTQLVGRAGADGFHCEGTAEDLAQAIEDLAPARIVGAANVRSRHDAMEAGEAEATYVFFGNLTPGETRGNADDLLLDRVAWWQPIFETPCVALATRPDMLAPLGKAGADFVALDLAVFDVAMVAAAEAALATCLAEAPA
jgi:thiamine-phosphate pyrophosphorylase